MKVVIFLCLLSAVHCLSLKGDELQRKTVLQTEDEVDVLISDKSGNPVSENDIFEQDGFEVVKPKNRKVCLVKQIGDSNVCFDEQPLTFAPPSTIQTRCEERRIIVLKATECHDGSETDQDGGRQKRQGSWCSWVEDLSSECAETFCYRRNIWGRCKGYRCKRWVNKNIKTYRCIKF